MNYKEGEDDLTIPPYIRSRDVGNFKRKEYLENITEGGTVYYTATPDIQFQKPRWGCWLRVVLFVMILFLLYTLYVGIRYVL